MKETTCHAGKWSFDSAGARQRDEKRRQSVVRSLSTLLESGESRAADVIPIVSVARVYTFTILHVGLWSLKWVTGFFLLYIKSRRKSGSKVRMAY